MIDDSFKLICEPDCKNINDIINICANENYQDITFIGDGIDFYEDILINNLPNSLFGTKNELSSYSLGLAGFFAFNSGRTDDILPVYLRKPQAERALEEKKSK